MASTLRCVQHPGKMATHWSGHLHKGQQSIAAGWCNGTHHKSIHEEKCPGCQGNWKPIMGLTGYLKPKTPAIVVLETILEIDDIYTIKKVVRKFLGHKED